MDYPKGWITSLALVLVLFSTFAMGLPYARGAPNTERATVSMHVSDVVTPQSEAATSLDTYLVRDVSVVTTTYRGLSPTGDVNRGQDELTMTDGLYLSNYRGQPTPVLRS